MDGSGCIENSECGQHREAAKYAGLQLLSWLCLCTVFLYQGRYAPLIGMLPKRLKPSGEDDGVFSALVYFYQLASVVVPKGKEKLAHQASGAFCVLSSAIGTSQLSDWAGCTKGDDVTFGFCDKFFDLSLFSNR